MHDRPVRPRRTSAQFLAYLEQPARPQDARAGAAGSAPLYRASKDVAELPRRRSGDDRRPDHPRSGRADPARGCSMRAPTREPGPVVVFFHGGGFVIGDLDTHASFCAEIARRARPAGGLGRLPPRSRAPLARRARRLRGGGALGRGQPGRTRPRRRPASFSAATAPAALSTIVTAMALRDAPAAVPVIVQAPIYPATDWTRSYPSYDDFAEGYLLTARRHGLVRRSLRRRCRAHARLAAARRSGAACRPRS